MSIPARLRAAPSFLAAVALAWVPMLVWFTAFRPGLMSADSLEIWRQANEGGWVDLHPVPYTIGMWLSAELVGSPALLTLAQSLLLAWSIVALARASIALGANRRLVIAVTAVVACTPMVGAFSISLWKDVPYTAALLMVAARLIDLARARLVDDPRLAVASVRSMVLWGIAATVLRQNGLLVVGALFVVLLLFLPELRRWLLGGVAACLLAMVLLKVVVNPALDVSSGPANSEVSTLLHDIASVAARDPRALDAGDRELLERAAPVQAWSDAWRAYSCATVNWQYLDVFRWRSIDGYQGDYVSLWLELARENPRAVAGNRLCVGAIAWRPDNVGTLYTVSRGVDENPYGVRTAPLVGSLTGPMRDVLDVLDEPSAQWWAWRAPTWIYVAYLVLGVSAWRRRMAVLLLPCALLVSMQVAIAALNPAQDARYMAAGLFTAMLVLPLATTKAPRRSGDDGPPATRSDADRVSAPFPPIQSRGALLER